MTTVELVHVIKNPEIGRTREDQITIADLTGGAIQDIQIAKMVDRALIAGKNSQQSSRQVLGEIMRILIIGGKGTIGKRVNSHFSKRHETLVGG